LDIGYSYLITRRVHDEAYQTLVGQRVSLRDTTICDIGQHFC